MIDRSCIGVLGHIIYDQGDEVFVPYQLMYDDDELTAEPFQHPLRGIIQNRKSPTKEQPRRTNDQGRTAKPKKTEKRRPPGRSRKEDESAFLDSLLAEQKTSQRRSPPPPPANSPVSTSANPSRLALMEKMKQRKAGIRDPLSRVKVPAGGQKNLTLVLEEQPSEKPVMPSNKEKLRDLVSPCVENPEEFRLQMKDLILSNYQDLVTSGALTMEEAVDRAFCELNARKLAGKESSKGFTDMTDLGGILSVMEQDNDPETLDYRKRVKEYLGSVVGEIVEHSLTDSQYVDTVFKISEYERSAAFDYRNQKVWESMCSLVYKRFKDNVSSPVRGTDTNNPIKYYESILKDYMAAGMIKALRGFDLAGVFNKYDPAKQPLVITSFQKDSVDLFPHIELIMSLDQLIEKGLAPCNARFFNPYNAKPLAYGLFWSLGTSFSLFGAFFRSNEIPESYLYWWTVYDRRRDDVDMILEIPLQRIKEVKFENENDEIHFQDGERVTVGNLIDLGITMGTTETLETKLRVSAAVGKPEFLQSVAREVHALQQENE